MPAGEGGLSRHSVALCHQMRVLDQSRLVTQLGHVSDILAEVERVVAFTLGMRGEL